LADATVLGFFIRTWPSPEVATGTAIREYDFAMAVPSPAFVPAYRARLLATPYDSAALPAASSTILGGQGTSSCYLPNLCTAAGPPTLTSLSYVRSEPWVDLPGGVELVDWDGDGDLDYLVASGRGIVWFENRGPAEPQVLSLGQSLETAAGPVLADLEVTSVDVVDMDHDGDLDLLWGTSEGVLYRASNLLNTTPPTLAAPTAILIDGTMLPEQGGSVDAEAVDWDNDGDYDLITGTMFGAVALYRNSGSDAVPVYGRSLVSGVTDAPFGGTGTALALHVTVTDWNVDGRKDLVAYSTANVYEVLTVAPFLNTGTDAAPAFATVPVATNVPTGSASAALGRVADVDGNGVQDIIVVTDNRLGVYLNSGTTATPSYLPHSPFPGGVVSLPPTAHIARMPWDMANRAANHDRDLLVGTTDGRLWRMVDRQRNGTLTPHRWEPVCDDTGIPLSLTPPVCPGLLESAVAEPTRVLLGSGAGRLGLYENAAVDSGALLVHLGDVSVDEVPLAFPDMCATGLFLNADPYADLVIASSNGQLYSALGTEAPLAFEALTPLLTTPQAGEGLWQPRTIDWDDDQDTDIILSSAAGHVWFAENSSGSRRQLAIARMSRLTRGDDKLFFSGGASVEGFDFAGDDCAKDLLVATGDGRLAILSGTIDLLPRIVARYPLASTELTADGRAFHDGRPALRWLLDTSLVGRLGRIRLELAHVSDFSSDVTVLLLPESGYATSLPEEFVDYPATALERRTFWRVRWESAEGQLGPWSALGALSRPGRGLNPVDREPFTLMDGRTRVGNAAGTTYENAKVADGAAVELPERDRFMSLTEVRTDLGFELYWGYELELAPFGNTAHASLLLTAQSDDAEKFTVSAWEPSGWVDLTKLSRALTTLTVPLSAAMLADGRVRLLIHDAEPDDAASSIRIDQLALVDHNQAPVASAGIDQSVESGTSVLLDASASTDPDGDPLTVEWVQLSGTPVVLQPSRFDLTPTFEAPPVVGGELLAFRVNVSDQAATAHDEVVIEIENPSAAQLQVASLGASDQTLYVKSGEAIEPLVLTFGATRDVLVRSVRFDVDGEVALVDSATLVASGSDTAAVAVGVVSGSTLLFENLDLSVSAGATVERRLHLQLATATVYRQRAGLAAAGILMVPAVVQWRKRRQRHRGLWVLVVAGLLAFACAQGTRSYSSAPTLAIRLTDPSDVWVEEPGQLAVPSVVGLPVGGPRFVVELSRE